MTYVVIGMPASGKTSVGQMVARQLGEPFRDADALIEARSRKLIREIFTDSGEEAFRALEEEIVLEALPKGGVLSLGGGSVLSPAIREALHEHTVVWLEVSVATATRRAGMNALRPLLLGDVRERMQTLLDARTPLYEEVATHRVNTERRPAAEVAAEVVRVLTQEVGE